MNLPKETFEVIIKNSQEVLFSGSVHALSSTNEKGAFDILSAHGAFVSLVEDFVRVYTDIHGKNREFKLTKGVIHVKPEGEVLVFVKN